MALRDAEPLKDEPSTLERIFGILQRPQYAVSSLVTGHPLDALENVVRGGEELLTGSWLTGFDPLSKLVGEQAKSGRPQGSDVLRRWGFEIDRGGWGEMAADVGVGALLDPLTYVGGIGLDAKVGRLAASELVGLGARGVERAGVRAAAEAALARAGATTDDLLRAIHAADAQPTIRRVLAEETARLRAAQEARVGGVGPLDDLLTSFAPGSLNDDALNQLARKRAAERIGLDLGNNRVSLIGTDAQAELLDAGIRGLEGQGLVRPAGVPTIEIPGVTWHALPGSAAQWSKIGFATPAHALHGLIGLASPAAAEGIGKVAAEAVEGLRKTFVDRLGFGKIPAALQAEAVKSAGLIARTKAGILGRVGKETADLSPDALRAIGGELLKADDLLRRGPTEEQIAEATRRIVERQGGFPSSGTIEEIRTTLPWLGTGDKADGIRIAWHDTRQRAIDAAAAKGGSADAAGRAIDAYVDDMRRIPEDLVDAGVWTKGDATPFYFPHQANDALAMFLASGSASKRAGSGGLTYAEALRDAFTKSREHANLAETLASFRKVAEHYGVPIPDLTDFSAHQTDLGAVFETDLSKLWARRMWAHADTLGRAGFEKTARETVTDLRHATVLDQFLDASLRGVGARETVIGKLLGGGSFRFTGAAANAAERLEPWLGGKAAAVGGQRGWLYQFPGINAFVKPALYLPSIATYTRNAIGGIVMGAMDPEIGLGGASGLASILRDLPIVKAMSGAPRDLQAVVIAAARGKPYDAAALVGRKIGGHDAVEVVEHLRNGVLGSNVVTDKALFESVGSVREFVDEVARQGAPAWEAAKNDWRAAITGKGLTSTSTGARALERYRRLFAPLQRVNQAVEDGLRGGAYMQLLANGYDPATAAKRVRDTFVDYAYQSGSERLVRDLLPFSRFTLGAGPNAIAGLTSGTGRAVGRLAVGSDDGRPLPNEIRRQVSIPVPGMSDTYATSLGLPFEAGGALLGLVPGAAGWSRNTEQNVLGALSPQPKALLENVVDKQFYSDLPLSEVRPIANLPPFASHALFGFLPLSRVWGEAEKWIKATHGDVRSLVNATTGIKLRTVDSEREAEAVLRRYLERAVQEGDVQSMTRFFAGKGEPVKPEVKAALEALAARERARRAKS